MILPINTPTQHIIIKTPYWKDRTIGIATHKVREHNEITILATDKSGKRFYPDRYYLAGDKIKSMPTEKVSNTVLYKIPISDLEVLERADV